MNVTAECTRVGKWWAVDIIGVEGGHTQTKRIDQVPDAVRDAVSFLANVPETSVKVDVKVHWGDNTKAIEAYHQARQKEAAATQHANNVTRTSIEQLREAGFSVRDIAIAFGVSHQRIHQMSKR